MKHANASTWHRPPLEIDYLADDRRVILDKLDGQVLVFFLSVDLHPFGPETLGRGDHRSMVAELPLWDRELETAIRSGRGVDRCRRRPLARTPAKGQVKLG